MPLDPTTLLQRGAPANVPPVDSVALWDRSRRRRARRRTLGAALGATVAVAAVGGGVALDRSPASQVVASAPLPAGVPPTFVAVDADNRVDVYATATGAALRTLLDAGSRSIQAVAVSSSEVFVATWSPSHPEIEEVPVGGGPAAVVANGADALAMALSPDGRQLAWVDGVGPLGAPLTVSVENLATGAVDGWSLNSLPHSGRDVFQPDALTWESADRVALLTSRIPSGGLSVGATSTTPTGRSSQACGSQVDCATPPRLTIVNTRAPATSAISSFRLPVPAGTVPASIDADNGGGFLVPGPTPGTLLVAAYPTTHARTTVYQLLVSAAQVAAQPVGTLPAGAAPVSLDGEALLSIDGNPGSSGRGYVERSEAYGPPAVISRHGLFFGAAWIPIRPAGTG